MSVSTTTAQNQWTSLVCLGVCTIVGASLVQNLLHYYRDTTIETKDPATTQYITQQTEDTLSPSTLKKLINSTTYSIREIATRIVCDRALHDESTLESLLWYITRSDHDTREKALRALYMLATKSSMAQLNKPRVYSAIVRSLSFCVTDVEHDPYDKEFDNWDLRDVNERLCLMIVHRFTTEFGIWHFIQQGFVSRWLAKEPWGGIEQEVQENITHCYHQNSLLSYIILKILSDPLGRKELSKAKLLGDNSSSPLPGEVDIRMINGGDTAGEVFLANFEILPSIEGGAPRIQERSAEEQRMRRNHRDAMVLHDSLEPLGLDSIITRDGANSRETSIREEAMMEADRQVRTQGLLAALTPRWLENMREILRSESHRMEQAGLEEEASVGILREILENEINDRIGGDGEGNEREDVDVDDTLDDVEDGLE